MANDIVSHLYRSQDDLKIASAFAYYHLINLSYLKDIILFGSFSILFVVRSFFLQFLSFMTNYCPFNLRKTSRIFHIPIFLLESVNCVVQTFFMVLILLITLKLSSIDIDQRKYIPELSIIRSEGCDSVSIAQGRSFNNLNVLIYDCKFVRSESFGENGGVIYLSGMTYILNLTSTIFSNCKTTTNGGAIYSESSDSYLSNVCAYQCYSAYYHFATLKSGNNNHVNFLSMNSCSNDLSGIRSLRMYYGSQIVKSINSSLNKAELSSGIYFNNPSNILFSFCTFSSNRVLKGQCIYFYEFTGTMSYTNIIDNDSPLSHGVIYMDKGNLNIDNCIMSINSNTLFNLRSGSIILSNCYVHHLALFSSSIEVNTTNNNNQFEFTPTHAITFFATEQCYAEIINTDQTLERTNIETPESTVEKTIIETPESAVERTIIETPESTVEKTIIETPESTVERTIIETPESTVERTYIETPESTVEKTIIETPESTVERTNIETPESTVEKTIIETPESTVEKTIIETPESTVERTNIETPESTVERTTIETLRITLNDNQDSAIIAYTVVKVFLIIAGLFVVIYGISFMKITYTSESSLSEDKDLEAFGI